MVWERRRSEITGAIFPFSSIHVQNLFSSNRDAFVKFTKLKLEKGAKIIFYVVGGEKLLVGEAKVRKVEKLAPDAAWSLYEERLILSKKEYDNYIRVSPVTRQERKLQEITVFELMYKKKYKNPVRSALPITSSGRYLTREIEDALENRR